MSENQPFGPMLKAYRKAADHTQERLAELAGCSVETIKKIEAGRLRPGRQLAGLLADRLAVPEGEREGFLKAARAELAPRRPGPPAEEPGPSTGIPTTPLTRAGTPPAEADITPAGTLPRPAPLAAIGRLWLWWIVAGAVGLGVGRALGWYVGSLIYRSRVIELGDGAWIFGVVPALIGECAVIGAVVGAAQAGVLHRRVAWPAWWGATLFVWLIVGPLSRAVAGALGGALLGLAAGLFQWPLLRRSPRAGWWAAASALAAAPLWPASIALSALIYRSIGGGLVSQPYDRGAGWALALLVSGSLVGALWGVLSGGALGWLLAAAPGHVSAPVARSPMRSSADPPGHRPL